MIAPLTHFCTANFETQRDWLLRALALTYPYPFRPLQTGTLKSAVAVLIGSGKTLLMLRPQDTSMHSHQWSFPGGRCEKGETSVQAALRETFEEVGLKIDAGTWLGALPEIHVPSGFTISPEVFHVPNFDLLQAKLNPNPLEVKEARFVSLELLEKVYEKKWREVRGIRFENAEFDIAPPLPPIWGATGAMLANLFERIALAK